MKKTVHKCEGKRRQWRGHTLGTYKCGRNATGRVETRVGTTVTRWVCDDEECYRSIAEGYPAVYFPNKP